MNLLPRLTSILSCILSRIPKHTCTPFHLRFLLRFHLFSHLSRAKSPFSLAFNFLPLASLPIYQSFDSRFSSGVHTHTLKPHSFPFFHSALKRMHSHDSQSRIVYSLSNRSLSLSLFLPFSLHIFLSFCLSPLSDLISFFFLFVEFPKNVYICVSKL